MLNAAERCWCCATLQPVLRGEEIILQLFRGQDSRVPSNGKNLTSKKYRRSGCAVDRRHIFAFILVRYGSHLLKGRFSSSSGKHEKTRRILTLELIYFLAGRQATASLQSRFILPDLSPGSAYVALVWLTGATAGEAARVEFSTPEVGIYRRGIQLRRTFLFWRYTTSLHSSGSRPIICRRCVGFSCVQMLGRWDDVRGGWLQPPPVSGTYRLASRGDRHAQGRSVLPGWLRRRCSLLLSVLPL